MGSYEEWVVDREVDAAWLQFRVRLADRMGELSPAERIDLRVDMGARSAAVVMRCWSDEHHRVGASAMFETSDGLRQRPAPGLRRFGFAGGSKIVSVEQADDLALSVERWFRLSRSVPHPVFVDVVAGDLVLVDPPQDIVARPAVAAALPESVMPGSIDELRDLVRRAVVERLGREPLVGKDGSIILSRGEDAVHLRISRSRRIIEVWSVVARGVDDRKARKLVARMGARFHFFSFTLHRDRVFVSTTVNAGPFCPEHLDRAIDSTFAYLEDHAPKLRARLQRRSDEQATDVSNLNADLVLVLGAAGNRKVMVELARGLAGDSRTTLGEWRRIATESAATARLRAGAGQHGTVQNALIDQVIAWRSVAEALTDAVAEIADEREAA